MSSILARPIQLLLAALVISAAISDIRSRRVPNWITIPGLVLAIVLNTWLPHGAGLRSSLLGLAVASIVYLIFFALRAMGAGDVKLLAATGALLGPYDTWIAGICTLLVGAVLAVMYLAAGAARAVVSAPASTSFMTRMTLAHLRVRELRRERMPYALAIALGSLASISLSGELAQALNPIWGPA